VKDMGLEEGIKYCRDYENELNTYHADVGFIIKNMNNGLKME
jgi:hypothetical protein